MPRSEQNEEEPNNVADNIARLNKCDLALISDAMDKGKLQAYLSYMPIREMLTHIDVALDSTNPFTPYHVEYIRQQWGISQADLANLLSVPFDTLIQWEKGEAVPPRIIQMFLSVITTDIRAHSTMDIRL
jgi:DNA-binding transcriptional regulator YiaG